MPSLIASALAIVALGASPPADRGFCRSLKQVIAATADNFVALQPREIVAGERWDIDVQLDYGQWACALVPEYIDPPGRMYECVAPDPSSGSEEAGVVARLVTACLGVPMAESTWIEMSRFEGVYAKTAIAISYYQLVSTPRSGSVRSRHLALSVSRMPA